MIRHRYVQRTIVIVAFAYLSMHGTAFAQPESSSADESKAAAQAVFDEGMRLFRTKDYAAACPKFQAAAQLIPDAIGVRGKLAECYDKLAKYASAWAAYREVATLAKRKGQRRRARIARRRAAKLKKKLSHVMIQVPEAHRVPGLEVTRDGVTITSGAFGVPVAADAGKLRVEASAEGFITWRTEVELARRATETVEIPMLERKPVPDVPRAMRSGSQTPVELRETDKPPSRRWKRVGIGAAIGGGALVATGAVFGLVARGQWNDAFDSGLCQDDNICTPEGFDKTASARRNANLATAFVGIGLVSAAVGTALWLWTGDDSQDAPPTAWRLAPDYRPGQAALIIGKHF